MHTCLLCSKHFRGTGYFWQKIINVSWQKNAAGSKAVSGAPLNALTAPHVFIPGRVPSVGVCKTLRSCWIVSPVFCSQRRWQTARTVSTVGRTSEGRSLSAMKANQCASAATPSSAPTPVPSATDPSPWSPRYNSISLLCLLVASLTCSSGHQELHHKGRYWHEECFRCAKCYKNLAKEPFSTKDERIMCGKCCSKEAAPRCHGCYKSILAGMINYFTGRNKSVFFFP